MKLTVVIIAKNEEKVIKEAIESAAFADEVLIIDSGSNDKTVNIAKKLGARVVEERSKGLAFSKWRTSAIKKARGDWIFYLDSDERITPKLKKEILETIRNSSFNAYAVPRANFYLGKRVKYGGSWPDYVKRLFLKKKLKRWKGKLHEEPIFEGELGHLKNHLEHYTHRDLTSMLEKTIKWSKLEAEELYQAGHPPVSWWRILRIMATELWQRGIKEQAFRDGTVGIIELTFQIFSRFITYARLWEMQELKKR